MKNPYDIYNDNRAYFGYERCREDILTIIKSGIVGEDDIDNFLKKLVEVISE